MNGKILFGKPLKVALAQMKEDSRSRLQVLEYSLFVWAFDIPMKWNTRLDVVVTVVRCTITFCYCLTVCCT